MKKKSSYRTYASAIVFSCVAVCLFATLQMQVALAIDPTPSMYIVPLAVGAFFGFLIARVQTLRHHLKITATTDALTGLHNRQWLNNRIKESFENYHRYKTKLAIIMLDIDNFKKVNDTHGHIVGDRVLVELASTIQHSCRATDKCSRWGGEEFIILLPNTNLEGAKIKAEVLRKMIEEIDFPVVNNLTCSFGITELCSSDVDQTTLIDHADQALYAAKNKGKNCVVSTLH